MPEVFLLLFVLACILPLPTTIADDQEDEWLW